MFRPIKNFINYIQKNASSSAIFGSSTTIADTETEPDADEVGIEATKINNNIIKAEVGASKERNKSAAESCIFSSSLTEQRESKKMKRMQINKVNIVNCNSVATVGVAKDKQTNGVDIHVESDDDDIENQIKSSVMMRQPLKPLLEVENLTDELDGDGNVHVSVLDRSDVDSQEDDDEEYPPISLVSDDGTIGGGDDTAEEDLITEGDDTEETFLELTSDQDHRYEDSEIVVIGDDVNCSIASDAPSEDPLAIDDLTQPSITSLKDASNPLDSSTNDEASTSTDLWSSIDHLKKNSVTPNVEKDLPSSPRRPLNTSKETIRPGANNNSTGVTMLSTQTDEHAEELRSDGSDSGLGSETSALQITLPSVADSSQLVTTSDNSAANTPNTHTLKLMNTSNDYSSGTSNSASTLTLTDSIAATSRAIEPVAVTSAISPLTTSSKPLRSNLKRRLDDDDTLVDETELTSTDGTLIKKLKRSINFDNVEVFYFPRQQGFGCVPSAGGCTLGMGSRHIGFKTLTLAEHAAELRRAHRMQLQEINPRGSSSDDSEESEEDYLSEGSGSDLDAESNGFLQPVSPKQRRALLKAAGIRKIDAGEKIDCRNIRNSREVCGCSCVEFCDPETCACSQAGIKCQVDRAMFPCGCTRDACGNVAGRVEFNPTRVRTHFIHTIMRLEMENRQQQNPPLCSTMSSYSLSAACGTSSTLVGGGGPHASGISSSSSYANSLPGSFYSMQTQSNYSSGYASPAYTSEPAANYYQQQSSSTTTTHFSAVGPTDIQSSTQQNYQLDALDAGLYTGTATATPVYGEILSSYSSSLGVSASTGTVSGYHQNINYSSGQQTQVSTYTAYQQAASSGYSSQHTQHSDIVGAVSTTVPPPTTFSSCAVPSLPPYGAATTTAAAAQYEDSSSYALVDTTAPSCIAMEDSGGSDGVSNVEGIVKESCLVIQNSSDNSSIGSDTNGQILATNNTENNNTLVNNNSIVSGSCRGFSSGSDNPNDNESDSSFIQLNAPVSSASRLSQINDLLQHNRHTTATLVAVSNTASLCENSNSAVDKPIGIRSVTTDCDYNDSNSNNSLLDVKDGNIPEKGKEIVTSEDNQMSLKKRNNTASKENTEETKEKSLTTMDAEFETNCAAANQKANTDVGKTGTLSATFTSTGNILATDDSKANTIAVDTNTTTATDTYIAATSLVDVDSK